MLERIRKIVTPPVFENDEDKTRDAAILNTILWSLLGVLVIINHLFSIVNFLTEQVPPDMFISLIAVAIFSGMLVHQGFVRGISYLIAKSLAEVKGELK